jgi:hypothetical protein
MSPKLMPQAFTQKQTNRTYAIHIGCAPCLLWVSRCRVTAGFVVLTWLLLIRAHHRCLAPGCNNLQTIPIPLHLQPCLFVAVFSVCSLMWPHRRRLRCHSADEWVARYRPRVGASNPNQVLHEPCIEARTHNPSSVPLM